MTRPVHCYVVTVNGCMVFTLLARDVTTVADLLRSALRVTIRRIL